MFRVATRGLLVRKTRLVLTALAVALGVTLIAGTYVFTDTINSSFDQIFAQSNKGTDVSITPKTDLQTENGDVPPIPASILASVRRLPDVASAEGSLFDQSGTILGKDGKRVGAGGAPNFIASAHLATRFEAFKVADGHLPRNAHEVVLDKATAREEKFKLGDKIALQGERPKTEYTLVGLAQIAGVDSFGGAAVALLTLPEAQRLTGKEGEFDEIEVAGKPGVSKTKLKQEVRAIAPRDVDVRTGQEQAAQQSADIRDNLGFLQTALLAFAGISLFVGAFIIFNTFSITVVQRSREFALLRMLGATRRQVLRSVLGEGLFLGVLGSGVGLALGIFVASGLRALFKAIGLELPSNGTVIETRTIVVSLLVGTIVTLLSCIAPALRATRVPPIAALREDAVVPQSRHSRLATPLAAVLTLAGVGLMAAGLFASLSPSAALSFVGGGAAAMFLGVALLSPRLVRPIASVVGAPLERLFGVTGRLARENTVRQPGRTAVTAAALMVGVALVTFAAIFAASANTTFGSAVDSSLKGQAVIQNTDGFSAFSHEATRAIGRVPGVDRVAAVRFVTGRIDGKKEQVTGVDGRLPTVYKTDWIKGNDDVLRNLDQRSVVVSKKYAEDHGTKVGDTLAVTAPGGMLPLRVAGILHDTAGLTGTFVISNALVQQAFRYAKDNFVLVGFSPGADATAVKKAIDSRLKTEFPQVEALTADEFKQNQADQLNQLLTLIYALLALTIIVSLFGIVNTLVLSITERTRELGMLRAIGTSRRQVRRMIRYESVITTLIGGVLGLGLGIVLSILVSRPIDDFTFSIPVGTLIAVLIVTAIAGVLAAVLPARRASRLDVLEALAYE